MRLVSAFVPFGAPGELGMDTIPECEARPPLPDRRHPDALFRDLLGRLARVPKRETMEQEQKEIAEEHERAKPGAIVPKPNVA